MMQPEDSPQTSEGITIELLFREDSMDEWPEPLTTALDDIIQTDPLTDIDSINLRLSSKYDSLSKGINNKWEFLTIYGQPLSGRVASQNNLSKFFDLCH